MAVQARLCVEFKNKLAYYELIVWGSICDWSSVLSVAETFSKITHTRATLSTMILKRTTLRMMTFVIMTFNKITLTDTNTQP